MGIGENQIINITAGIPGFIPHLAESTASNAKPSQVAELVLHQSRVGHVSSKVLKTKAIAIGGLKIAAESTANSLGRMLGLVMGAILAPVNTTIAGVNLYDLIKNFSAKSKEEIMSQLGMITGNLALVSAGVSMIKAHLVGTMALKMAAMSTAKIAGAVGLFSLSLVHIGKAIASIAKLKSASPEERKELLLSIISNLFSAAGLILLGLVILGVLTASVSSPFGWIALGLILVGVSLEVAHGMIQAKKADRPYRDTGKTFEGSGKKVVPLELPKSGLKEGIASLTKRSQRVVRQFLKSMTLPSRIIPRQNYLEYHFVQVELPQKSVS